MEVFGNEAVYTLKKNTLYQVTLRNLTYPSMESESFQILSDAKGIVNFAFNSYPDTSLGAEIVDFSTGAVVLIDTLDVVTPYATASTILAYMEGKVNPTQAVEYERLARHMINTVVGFPFKREFKSVEAVGNNTDSLVLTDRIIEVNTVWENNIEIWNSLLTEPDYAKQAFVRGVSPYVLIRNTWDTDERLVLTHENRLEHTPTWPTRYSLPLFKYEYDYVIEGTFGWPVVPQDIQDATLLLINDIACGNNRYTNKYIRQWSGGGVAMSFSDQVFAGTGNLIVDNILEKYKMEAIRARML